MRTLILLFLFFNNVCQDDNKFIEIEFFKYGKRIDHVHYYYLDRDTATLLPYQEGKIKIGNELLKKRHFTVVAVYKSVKINFRVEASSNHIIIKAYKKGLFGTYYQINQELEYDEVALPYKRHIFFKN